MAPPHPTPTSRLESFSDAVFAFAATLLVVSLEVPRDFDALVGQLYGFAAFAVTFGALIAIWTVHRAFFRRFPLDDGWTVFLNACLLFVVLFYVFPLKFLTESSFASLLGQGQTGIRIESYEQLSKLFVLYGAGFTGIFLCISLMYRRAWRISHRESPGSLQSWQATNLSRHYLLFAIVGLASMAIAATELGIRFGLPGLLYFALGPFCYANSVWSEKHRPNELASSPA